MNLYRLDFHHGHVVEPVRDFLGDVLIRSHAKALERAKREAAEHDKAVVVTRIYGAGRLRPMLRIRPDGTRARLS